MEEYRCPRCATYKPMSEFSRNRANKKGRLKGHHGYCKPCHNEIVKENRAKHHGSTRNFHLKRRYGVDAVQVEWMKLQQNYRCALCGENSPEHVDHDHETGQVRGILCFNCNRALGYLHDDAELLYRIADYLEGATKG